MAPASTDASSEENAYNYIYEKLVESSDDINGMIAYSLYKREKIQFIRDFALQYNRNPTDVELKSFHLSSNTEARLNAYRLQAGVVAREFLEISLAEKVREIEDQWGEGYLQGLIGSDLKELKGFGRGVIQGVVSSWIFSFSVALVLLGAVIIRVGPSDVFNEIVRMVTRESNTNELPSRPAKEPQKKAP